MNRTAKTAIKACLLALCLACSGCGNNASHWENYTLGYQDSDEPGAGLFGIKD